MTQRDLEEHILAIVRHWVRAQTRRDINRLERALRAAVADYEASLSEEQAA